MGERVMARIVFGPWDEEKMGASEDCRQFLEQILAFCFEEQAVVEDQGVAIMKCEGYEVNYGTNAFREAKLVEHAQHLGLWCSQGDEGRSEWDQHHEVYSPEKCAGEFFDSYLGEAMLTPHQFGRFVSKWGEADALTKIRQYFVLGSRSLDEWISAEVAES
ncbi:MAG: hypothetical protein ACYDHP_09490 [Ferrimicrobium sp.]